MNVKIYNYYIFSIISSQEKLLFSELRFENEYIIE